MRPQVRTQENAVGCLMEPTRTTVKRLFAVSRNHCAFPGCELPIVEDSGTITGIICHIRARSKGGPRFDPKQSDEARHAFENLILMCGRHSKVIDSEPRLYTVAKLQGFKVDHDQPGENEISAADGIKVDRLLAEYRAIYINASQVVIESAAKVVFTKSKRPTIAAPAGSIGSDLLRRNYAKHLIDRYNDFASKQPGREDFSFAAIYSMIEKRYGVKKWEMVPLSQFDDLCGRLQERIDKTRQGCINRGKGIKNYSTSDEYRTKYSSEG